MKITIITFLFVFIFSLASFGQENDSDSSSLYINPDSTSSQPIINKKKEIKKEEKNKSDKSFEEIKKLIKYRKENPIV